MAPIATHVSCSDGHVTSFDKQSWALLLKRSASSTSFCMSHLQHRRWSTITTAFSCMLERIGAYPGALLSLLLSLSLVQGMLGLWAVFGMATERIPPTHTLTLLGAALYQPDHDFPIYVLGIVACVVMDALLSLMLAKTQNAGGAPFNPRVALLVCEIVVLLPVLLPNSRFAHLLACVIGLAWLAWQLKSLRHGRSWLTTASEPWTAPAGENTGLARSLSVPLAIVALFVFVPWPEALVWQSFAGDRFHHFDFYAMAPALAHAHGLRLASDFYSQYGVGWSMVLHWLGATSGVGGYTTFVRLEVLVGCAYFLMLFIFLRVWLRRTGHATAGLLVVLLLALFTNTGGYPKWLWPSSTVMRYAFDVALFTALIAHARSGDARLGPLAGALLGLQWLFALDVGLYLLLAFSLYLACALRSNASAHTNRAVLQFACGAVLGLVVVAGAGFTLANQGDFPGRIFWTGLTKSIFAYSGGIANMPIAQTLAQATSASLLLLAMLTLYVRCLGTALSGFLTRRMSTDMSLRAAIAAYGLGTLMLFIGRSHEQNLMHVCIPFCLLATQSLVSISQSRAASPLWLGLRRHELMSLGLVAVIWMQGHNVHYPNLANTLFGHDMFTHVPPTTSDALPTLAPNLAAEFGAASDAIRSASGGGQHSVAVIGYNDTAYLVQAGVAPYFSYSPVLASLLFQEQITEITQRIENAPPEWIFIAAEQEPTLYRESTADSVRRILASMERDYVQQGSAGHFQVFRRAATTVKSN